MTGEMDMNGDRKLASEDIALQAQQAFDSVGIILEEVDRGQSDVMKVIARIVDPRRVWRRTSVSGASRSTLPTQSHLLGINQLAGEEYFIEIEAPVEK